MTHPQLRRLKIHRYEQFVDVPWIEFSPHENLILGINGAGKTSLLRLIHAVLSFDYEKLLAQEFDVEFELAYPSSSSSSQMVEVTGRVLRKEQSPAEALKSLEAMDELNRIEATIDAHHDGHQLKFTVTSERATLALDGKDMPVSRKPARGRALPWEEARARGGAGATVLLPSFSSFFIREDDRDFRALVDDVEFSLAPDSARRFGIEDTGGVPPMLLLALLRHIVDSKEEKKNGVRFGRSDLLPDLPQREQKSDFQRLLAPLGSQSLLIRPKVVQETSEVLECKGLEVRVKFESGAEYADSRLTFGQRRYLMMGLLLLFRPDFPALIDEVDNGLHPRLVEAVLKLLQGRQSFLASHNKIVVDYVGYDSPEDVRQKIHVCRRAEDGKQTVDTLDEAAVQEVFEKISIGIMHPSDVLLVEGLW